MERPDIPALLREAHGRGCRISVDDVTYYVGQWDDRPSRGSSAAATIGWNGFLHFMQRNSVHVSDFFRLPPDAGRKRSAADFNLSQSRH